ncbi:hypothetical protein MA16_Dca023599 [Dendrobium catenatum]|uniref:Uncharacterized protein n=1 Tax=Dendrobium catenatum TaxID=906689 RepID=A0A2I0XIL2_9ASPA|nr:hypothetical protein MA16_Dca023599 [Dendrobium catenatum]
MGQIIHKSGDDPHLLMPNAQVEEACKEKMTTLVEGLRYLSLFEIAQMLAHLMLVLEEEERWHVVTMVWVELLFQVA